MDKLKILWEKTWVKRTIIGFILVLLVLMGIRACNMAKKSKVAKHEDTTTTTSSSKRELTQFEEEQKRLIERFGDPGKGYYWDEDGKRLALGDPNLSKTEVVNTFLRAVSTLDFATAQKYAYKDAVVKRVNDYFSKDAEFTYDESFKKGMYQEVLTSMEIVGIENSATFADDKANFAVKVKLLDLSNKDFWEKDEDEIFRNLTKYRKTESDSTKAKNYLYNYVTDYWKSEDAQKVQKTINITLMKTGQGGWLVSNDTDLDNFASYVDGETVVDNIMQAYNDSLDTGSTSEAN